eukprot:TRINITY_DN84535_c0_g1_i1.p1 TRINITY_DN84535_c0_g1~~TRINITY_DN84535_c0_g1_i1.p1  ORF type:complete len:429 (+),score=54.95 TRINITY_DN84535_c0_g1_i1:112-1398(+)
MATIRQHSRVDTGSVTPGRRLHALCLSLLVQACAGRQSIHLLADGGYQDQALPLTDERGAARLAANHLPPSTLAATSKARRSMATSAWEPGVGRDLGLHSVTVGTDGVNQDVQGGPGSQSLDVLADAAKEAQDIIAAASSLVDSSAVRQAGSAESNYIQLSDKLSDAAAAASRLEGLKAEHIHLQQRFDHLQGERERLHESLSKAAAAAPSFAVASSATSNASLPPGNATLQAGVRRPPTVAETVQGSLVFASLGVAVLVVLALFCNCCVYGRTECCCFRCGWKACLIFFVLLLIAAAGFGGMWMTGVLQPLLKQLVVYVYLVLIVVACVGIAVMEVFSSVAEMSESAETVTRTANRFDKMIGPKQPPKGGFLPSAPTLKSITGQSSAGRTAAPAGAFSQFSQRIDELTERLLGGAPPPPQPQPPETS